MDIQSIKDNMNKISFNGENYFWLNAKTPKGLGCEIIPNDFFNEYDLNKAQKNYLQNLLDSKKKKGLTLLLDEKDLSIKYANYACFFSITSFINQVKAAIYQNDYLNKIILSDYFKKMDSNQMGFMESNLASNDALLNMFAIHCHSSPDFTEINDFSKLEKTNILESMIEKMNGCQTLIEGKSGFEGKYHLFEAQMKGALKNDFDEFYDESKIYKKTMAKLHKTKNYYYCSYFFLFNPKTLKLEHSINSIFAQYSPECNKLIINDFDSSLALSIKDKDDFSKSIFNNEKLKTGNVCNFSLK